MDVEQDADAEKWKHEEKKVEERTKEGKRRRRGGATINAARGKKHKEGMITVALKRNQRELW